MKILAIVLGIVITVVMLAAGFALSWVMLVALNGYHDRDGGVALQFCFVWSIVISVIFGIIAAILGFFFASRQPPNTKAFALSTGGTLLIGLIIEVIGGIVLTIGIAEFLRGR